MKVSRSLVLLLLFLPSNPIWAEGEPAREILRIRLSMSEEQVHARLKEIGTFVRAEPPRQEVWRVGDPSFSHVLIGFAKGDKLRYVTAVARKDKEAKAVPYASIGDLKKAEQKGDPKVGLYNYEWKLSSEKGEPETLVIALGRDGKHLSSLSLKRLGEGASAAED